VSARGPLPPAFGPLAHVAALGYALGVRVHGAWWAARRGADVGVPVISVGNVSAGGTGKTPFVRWVVEALRHGGRSPVIAMRGYRAHAGRSDEAEEYRAMLPEVPCAVGADRVRAIAAARAAHPSIDCAVLDDGFQHRRVARALDVVLVDATVPAIGGAMLPAGWLREPASALARADLVVVTRAAGFDRSLAELVRRFRGRDPDAWTRHSWDRVERLGPAGAFVPDASLRGRRAWVACAIGNPGAFVADVRAAGAEVMGTVLRRDHHAFTADEVERLARDAGDADIVLTGKDWAKVGPLVAASAGHAREARWWVPRASIAFDAGEDCVRSAVLSAASRAIRP
jgi:tetraacyldisaccharide 4'-kinase